MLRQNSHSDNTEQGSDTTRNRELQDMIFELMLRISDGSVNFDDIPSEKVKAIVLDKLRRAVLLNSTKKKEAITEIIDNEEFRLMVLRIMKDMHKDKVPPSISD